jgi:glycosyltransferase involved in cell wall biosynthesis
MNILWLSWKDPTHPDAGGAELAGEKHALAWIKAGHRVNWVSIHYPNAPQKDSYKGITIEHHGQKWMWYLGFIHLLFAYKYLTQWKNNYDCIVEEVHGPPLMTPLYVHKPTLIYIHEVAGEIWQKTIPHPLSWIMEKIIEPFQFQAYKNVPIMTVSDSTKKDLQYFGIPEKNIHVIHNGLDIPPHKEYPKETTPTLIFLSALRPIKGFERVYESYKEAKKSIPNLQLWVVGDDTSPYAQEIKSQIPTNENAITFFGKVTEEKKFELLQRAHLLVHGSRKEGWGFVILEANAVGTPAVAFDVPGLRDSIINKKTGFIVKNKEEFSQKILLLLQDTSKYAEIGQNAKEWSSTFTWITATNQSLILIKQELKNE